MEEHIHHILDKGGVIMTLVKVEISNLSGVALNWSVAVATGYGTEAKELRWGERLCGLEMVDSAFGPFLACVVGYKVDGSQDPHPFPFQSKYFNPTRVWDQGGNLFERLRSLSQDNEGNWYATTLKGDIVKKGETPLIAACRAVVAAELGGVVEIPAEVLEGVKCE